MSVDKLRKVGVSKKKGTPMGILLSIWVRALRLFRRMVDVIAGILFSLVYRGPGETLPAISDLILMDSASALAAKIRAGKVKSTQVVETYLSRMRAVDEVLTCVVDFREEEALKEAQEVDKLIASKQFTEQQLAKEKPFLGVPFTTKDCFPVTGLLYTAGFWPRRELRATRDAEFVTLMKKAGAIPLAVTNVSELCMWWESTNATRGRTRNPYCTHRIAGGSSGGEAALLAAAGSPMGIGSDIGGSIRMPSFFNGIFGHKPTTGIVSNDGQYPAASGELNNFLVTGPMSRYASDLLPIYRVLADKNVDKLELDKKVDITKLKYYYMEDDGGFPLISSVHPDIRKALHKVITHLDKAYGVKAQKVNIRKFFRSVEIWSHKMTSVGEAHTFCEELANKKGSVNPFWELLKSFFGLSIHTVPALVLGIAEKVAVDKGGSEQQRYISLCENLRTELGDLLSDNAVLLYPVHPTPAPYHHEPLLKSLNFAYAAIFNVLGFPATACPLGLSRENLPIGIQVVGSPYKDRLTLAVALELEKAFGGWVPPCVVE